MTEILGWAATAVFVASYFFARAEALRAFQMLGAIIDSRLMLPPTASDKWVFIRRAPRTCRVSASTIYSAGYRAPLDSTRPTD